MGHPGMPTACIHVFRCQRRNGGKRIGSNLRRNRRHGSQQHHPRAKGGSRGARRGGRRARRAGRSSRRGSRMSRRRATRRGTSRRFRRTRPRYRRARPRIRRSRPRVRRPRYRRRAYRWGRRGRRYRRGGRWYFWAPWVGSYVYFGSYGVCYRVCRAEGYSRRYCRELCAW
jgi:hypothetical protein